jgi:hypothetical protein
MSELTDLEKLKQEVEELKVKINNIQGGIIDYVDYIYKIYSMPNSTIYENMGFMRDYYYDLIEQDGIHLLLKGKKYVDIENDILHPVFAELENDNKDRKREIKIRQEQEKRERDERISRGGRKTRKNRKTRK